MGFLTLARKSTTLPLLLIEQIELFDLETKDYASSCKDELSNAKSLGDSLGKDVEKSLCLRY